MTRLLLPITLLLSSFLLSGGEPAAADTRTIPEVIAKELRAGGVPAKDVPRVFSDLLRMQMKHPQLMEVLSTKAQWTKHAIEARADTIRLVLDRYPAYARAWARNIHLIRINGGNFLQNLMRPNFWGPASVFGLQLIPQALAIYLAGPGGGGGGGAAAGAASSKGGFIAFPVLLVAVTGLTSLGAGYSAGKVVVEQQHLDAAVKESAAFFDALGHLETGMAAGRLKLLKGMTYERAINRILDNLDAGLPPFANVLELKPAPDISGAWTGDLRVKEVSGSSAVKVGQMRRLRGKSFTIEQDHNEVLLVFHGQRVRGYFLPQLEERLASTGGGKRELMIVDQAVLDEPLDGARIAEVRLKFHSGKGAGKLAGALVVEIIQTTPGGASITSGGMLYRSK